MRDIIREREAWTRWQKTIHFVNYRGPWKGKEKQEPLGWQGAKHFVAGVLEAEKERQEYLECNLLFIIPSLQLN